MRCAHVPSSSRAAAAAPLIAAAVGALFPTEPVRAQTTDTPTAAPAPATAASAPAETTLPVVRVRGTRETASSPVIGYAARRSGTATKTDTALNEVPQSITVIGAEQVRDQGSPNLQEALRYTAGVRTETYGVDNRGDWFSLRGGSNGSTLLDGMRRPLTGYWGIIRYEPYAFERIEVLRGPASVIAGQNGPGGVVNLVSKRPLAEHAAEVGIQLGNYDHKQVAGRPDRPAQCRRLAALSRGRAGQTQRHAGGPCLRRPRPDRAVADLAAQRRHVVHAVHAIPARRERQPQRLLPGAGHVAAGAERPDPDEHLHRRARLGHLRRRPCELRLATRTPAHRCVDAAPSTAQRTHRRQDAHDVRGVVRRISRRHRCGRSERHLPQSRVLRLRRQGPRDQRRPAVRRQTALRPGGAHAAARRRRPGVSRRPALLRRLPAPRRWTSTTRSTAVSLCRHCPIRPRS